MVGHILFLYNIVLLLQSLTQALWNLGIKTRTTVQGALQTSKQNQPHNQKTHTHTHTQF